MTEETGSENVRVAYEYVVKAHNDVIRQQDKNAERANKLILVVWLVFAALSYGATNLIDIAHHPARISYLFWISVAAGILAAIALVTAFLAAMMCARVRSIFIPATEGVRNVVGDPDFAKVENARIVGAFIDNLHEAIEAALRQQEGREKWLRVSNWVPQAAFVLTAVFVGLTFAQKVHLALQEPPSTQCAPAAVASHEIGVPMAKQEGDKKGAAPSEDKKAQILKEIKKAPREVRGSDAGKAKPQNKSGSS